MPLCFGKQMHSLTQQQSGNFSEDCPDFEATRAIAVVLCFRVYARVSPLSHARLMKFRSWDDPASLIPSKVHSQSCTPQKPHTATRESKQVGCRILSHHGTAAAWSQQRCATKDTGHGHLRRRLQQLVRREHGSNDAPLDFQALRQLFDESAGPACACAFPSRGAARTMSLWQWMQCVV